MFGDFRAKIEGVSEKYGFSDIFHIFFAKFVPATPLSPIRKTIAVANGLR
jgi:hypothetical protein